MWTPNSGSSIPAAGFSWSPSRPGKKSCSPKDPGYHVLNWYAEFAGSAVEADPCRSHCRWECARRRGCARGLALLGLPQMSEADRLLMIEFNQNYWTMDAIVENTLRLGAAYPGEPGIV